MLRWVGKRAVERVLTDRDGQDVVDLSGDVALEAADDLGFAQALLSAPFYVGAGARVVAEPAKNDYVEGSVGVAVAAAAEAVSVRAARCWRGSGPPRKDGRTRPRS